MIRVTFADGATEDREDDSDCYPDAHANFVSTLHINRGADVRVKVGVDEWRLCYVETCEEQIARLTAERDAWERAARDIAADSDARGATIWRLQNRLTRAHRRGNRAAVALKQWQPEALAWKSRCEEAQEAARAEKASADAAEKRLAGLRAWALKERGAVRDRGAVEAARGEDLAAAWCDGEAAALGELLQYIDGFPLREAVEWVVARSGGKDGESK